MEITLKAARINAGLTQEQVKAKTGYSRNSLYRWEKGIGSPKWKDLKRPSAGTAHPALMMAGQTP